MLLAVPTRRILQMIKTVLGFRVLRTKGLTLRFRVLGFRVLRIKGLTLRFRVEGLRVNLSSI